MSIATNMSLRARLIVIILAPLLIIACVISYWAVRDAQQRAEDRFDRSLLSAALAISRDVAVSDGDALSPETNALLRDTSGGPLFYHVYAPDGVFVTGYATPPVSSNKSDQEIDGQLYYDASYKGQDVRSLRFVDVMQIDGLSGVFTITVWQDVNLRSAIVRDLSWRTFRVIASLVLTVALVVWFGVRLGLRPLNDLQAAIAQRSSDELDPIKRQVPVETKGIVETLNRLLGQVDSSMQAKDEFISNAAHQLRNPIAGVVSMSEAVHSAKSYADAQQRSGELVLAARDVSDLAHKLLALERAKAGIGTPAGATFDVGQELSEVAAGFVATFDAVGLQFSRDIPDTPILVAGDRTLIREAVKNLLDNALAHGGATLSTVRLTLSKQNGMACLSVQDDGIGITPGEVDKALSRFGQLKESRGSGLGLAIAEVTARRHGGVLTIEPSEQGLSVRLTLEIAQR